MKKVLSGLVILAFSRIVLVASAGMIGLPGEMSGWECSNLSVTNVGGITYVLTETAVAPYCELDVSAVSSTQTNCWTQSFSIRSTGLGGVFGGRTWLGVSVLGPTPPGTNFFVFKDADFMFPSPEAPFPVQLSFVTPTNQTPTLKSIGVTNGLIQFEVSGIQGVKYTVQSSVDHTNWVSRATNSGAPFYFTEPVDLHTNRFYRTLIESEPMVGAMDPSTPQ